jgi:hypothetical protein
MTDKLEMPVEQFAEAVANENARLIRRNEQLVSGPGGIMEMKQTIVDKEAEIERLNKYRNMVGFIANDYHELSYEKAQWQRDDWKKRCRKLIEELESD